MANPVRNIITVIGLAPGTDFNAWLRKFAEEAKLIVNVKAQGRKDANHIKWQLEDAGIELPAADFEKLATRQAELIGYHIIEPWKPWTFEGVSHPRFKYSTKWASNFNALLGASKQFPEVILHCRWHEIVNWTFGVYTVKNGKMLDNWEADHKKAGAPRLDTITFSEPDFVSEHAGLNLPQLAKYRLIQATKIVEEMKWVLGHILGENSIFDDLRDESKRKKTLETVTAMLNEMNARLTQLDFTDVLIDFNDPRYVEREKQRIADLEEEHKQPPSGPAPIPTDDMDVGF